MIYTAIALFALAAILGMVLLTFVLQGKETPKGIVFSHGPLAAAGIILLIIYSFKQGPGPIEATVLFLIAAGGGIIMFIKDMTGKTIPKWLGIVHGLIAVTGFIYLIIFAFIK
ncbi:MAG: hypothetical protein H0V01_06460 [Bacteroidetes bacterium]|nr:hypothetical protein [Bacteroidota bacterium]HET6245170.1 hypothetical protein [Bacteroidia bacterium]